MIHVMYGLVITILLFTIFLLYRTNKKPKTFGKILLTRDKTMYIELNNEESLNKIINGKYATFKVEKEK